MVDSVSVRFKKRACRKNAFKHNRIQWNAGTACVSECVLKTLACRGLRVGPSKITCKEFGYASYCLAKLQLQLQKSETQNDLEWHSSN